MGIARVESPSDSCSLLLKCMGVGSEDKEEELRAGCVESYEEVKFRERQRQTDTLRHRDRQTERDGQTEMGEGGGGGEQRAYSVFCINIDGTTNETCRKMERTICI